MKQASLKGSYSQERIEQGSSHSKKCMGKQCNSSETSFLTIQLQLYFIVDLQSMISKDLKNPKKNQQDFIQDIATWAQEHHKNIVSKESQTSHYQTVTISLGPSSSDIEWGKKWKSVCSLTISYFKLFFGIMDIVSSGLRRKKTIHIVTSTKFKSQHL